MPFFYLQGGIEAKTISHPCSIYVRVVPPSPPHLYAPLPKSKPWFVWNDRLRGDQQPWAKKAPFEVNFSYVCPSGVKLLSSVRLTQSPVEAKILILQEKAFPGIKNRRTLKIGNKKTLLSAFSLILQGQEVHFMQQNQSQ